MSEKRKALGKGLSALLRDPATDVVSARDKDADKVVGAIALIDIAKIEVNPFQPRTHFDKEALEELSISIKEIGIVQPITVRKIEGGKYQIISGERRTRASKLAGLEQIPAYIRLADDQGMLEMALVENIQRQELDAIEVALSYKRLIEECNLTQEQMSDRVGKKRSTVTNYLRLLKLPPLIQAGLRDNMITMGHARALISVEEEEGQLQIYKETIAKEWSVRDVENAVKNLKEGPPAVKTAKAKRNLPEAFTKLKTQLKTHFDSNVDIALGAKGRGKIVIPFSSSKDLERIIKIMNQQD